MMQPWFPDAKLGIFIHWGIYAVDGIDESWAFFNGKISHADYMKQLGGFTAKNFDAKAWADFFVRSGAKYAVLTTKHHDGVALWDTKQSTPSLDKALMAPGPNLKDGDVGHPNDDVPLSIPRRSPAGRDLITPYVGALQDAGLKVGFYYSHLDWSHRDYASIGNPAPDANRFAHRSPETDADAWERFLAFHRAQLKELCTEFDGPDLLWFDGDWERDGETWRMKELRDHLHAWRPDMIINSRMQGHGDYETPEQGLPIVSPEGPWEFCMTINDSWGFQHKDLNFKSPRECLRIFIDTIGLGGNLLIDIGPREDGTIPDEQVAALEYIGDWIRRNEEAVYGTIGGLPLGHFHGPSTMSKDQKTLYLMVFGDGGGEISIRGLRTKIKRASVLGSGAELRARVLGGAAWMSVPGVVWIDLPKDSLDPEVSVVKIELEEPVSLYRGHGQGITQN